MGKKTSRDPAAPKPPLNAYMEFAREERPRVFLDLGKVSTTEVGKEIGERWKKLEDHEKEKFVKRFQENQERYKEEKLNYEKNIMKTGNEAPPSTTKNKKKRNPLAPKAPLSSYMEFASKERAKILEDLGNLNLVEVGRELGRRWKSLSEQEKEPFESMAKQNRSRYQIEMKAFTSQVLAEQSSSGPPQVSQTSPASDPTDESCTSTIPSPTVLAPTDPSDPSVLSLPVTSSQDPTVSSPTVTSGSVASSSLSLDSSTQQENTIRLEDLGFAKQTKYSWHPALKTGVLARGTRVKVTFFGTGQTGTVNKSKWTSFSAQAEFRFSTPELRKTASYRVGLQQMKALREKILSDQDAPTSSGIGFTPQMGGRRFRSLNKDHLQVEEEENIRQMAKKMSQEEDSQYWKCRDCPWRGKYSHKAKSHARDCGQRKKANKKKVNEKKFECSHGNCTLSFALRRQLLQHYR